MEERILAERCKAGDNDARRELYTRFGGRLLGICLRYVGDRATAEDLLHDCFIKVFAAIDRFSWRGEGSLRAWMERIAVNVSSDEMERLPYDDLKRLIAELPDGYRTVFNLYCIEELSHREIAERLGISEKTSSSQLFRAKALLARRIKEYVKDK